MLRRWTQAGITWEVILVIKNIQSLRFVAAFLVLIHHTLPPNVHPAHYARIPHFFTELSLYGFAGVDIFFVISGFIMAQTARQSPGGLHAGSEFIARRFLRIYTGYWPAFFLVLFLSVWLGVFQEPEISRLGSFFLLPQEKYLLNVAWTLTYELLFYLLIGVILCFTSRRAMAVIAGLFVLLALYVLVQHQRGFYVPGSNRWDLVLDTFLTSPLILEFMAGYLLNGLLHRFPRQRLLFWLPFALLMTGLSVWVQKWGGLEGVGMAAYLYYPERALLFGSAALGWVAVAAIAPEGRSWFLRLTQKLGDASYALYLLHIPLLVILYGVLFPRLGPLLWVGGGKLSLLVYIGTCLVMSWVYFRLVEIPLHQWSRRLVTRAFHRRPIDHSVTDQAPQ
ncbi:acyltransferase family protein [Ottowia thiooxydans]|uniref:acyltransferase family protein n=1 Tax=Ottowia thiooxydans TaxID=219182 RepID=UPI00146CEC14|nr:acyltransferase [Ottowia thiooxydans]